MQVQRAGQVQTDRVKTTIDQRACGQPVPSLVSSVLPITGTHDLRGLKQTTGNHIAVWMVAPPVCSQRQTVRGFLTHLIGTIMIETVCDAISVVYLRYFTLYSHPAAFR